MDLPVEIKIGNDIDDVYELSPLQEGMLFHVLHDPEAGMYFQQSVAAMKGMDVDAFEKAWQYLIDRHTILRTSFHWEGLDKPVQIVHRKCPFSVERLDWRTLSESDQKTRMNEFLRDERQRGLRLDQAPLLRVTVIQIDENTFYYVRCHHHILLDGWSGLVVLREFRKFYEALRWGWKLDLPTPRPYGDYIAWLRRRDVGKAETYWRDLLKAFAAATPLPEDYSGDRRYIRAGDRFDQRIVHLSEPVTTALQGIVRKHHITENTLLQGAWALVLSKCSGLNDICFGTLVSGRAPDLEGVEDMVGMFMNTLPVRIEVTENEFLMSWLKGILDQQIEMRQYEFSPLVQVQGWSEVKRGQPLFDSIVVYENFPREKSSNEAPRGQGGDSKSSRLNFLAKERTNYPLSVISAPSKEMGLRINFDRIRFNPEAVGRILTHLRVILEDIAANPERRLGDLSIISEAEKQHLLVDWNENRVALSGKVCAHHLFESQVSQRPDNVALTFEGHSLSYQELDRRANQLAHYLRLQGIGIEMPVALCLERGPEAIIGMLGILKAGGVYLPLDPNYSLERVQFMVGDARPAVILAQESLRERLSKGTRCICIDRDGAAIAAQPDTRLESGVAPINLAYIIYTVSSKGFPTGVQIEHRSVVNLVLAQLPLFNMAPGDKALQMISLCVDASLGEIFRTLGAGATLCLARQDDLTPGPGLAKLLREQAVTAITTTATILASLPMEDLPRLRTLMVVGTALTSELAERWSHGRRLLNSYGPTETTIGATLAVNWEPNGKPPIGRPLTNVQVYILDRHQRPVPIGVPGELYIGGAGVTRGYLNRADLTAEHFIPNPFSVNNESGSLYRTGDLVRWLSDGQIDFLGRVEQEVTLQEANNELGEVDLKQLYNAYRHSVWPQLLESPLQNDHFDAWQRKVVQGIDLRKHLFYWRNVLDGAEPVDLPLDKPRPPIQTHHGARQAFHIPQDVAEKLRELSRQEDATMFVVALAAFKVLLAKYCRQDDITVGTPIAKSGLIDQDQIIGFFPNTLALRTHLPRDISFREAVGLVRQTCVGAYAHQDMPFEKLVEELQPVRDLSRNPIIQIMFSLKAEFDDGTRAASTNKSANGEGVTARFDLTLNLTENSDDIQGLVLYNTTLWEKPTIVRMAGHYATLLQEAVAQPDRPVEELSLMSGQEQRELLDNWNDTAVDYPGNTALLHRLIEAQVERTPDAVALVYENNRLSHREFNNRANQLAHRLRKLGVGIESLVGVCAERSLEMVLALHATLKAGAAYVPLDPEYPANRLDFLIKDAGVTVILTQQHLLEKVSNNANVLVLDSGWSDMANEPESNLDVAMNPANLAYVIYTSGSTGVPKGVMNAHRGICNRLLWMQDEYKLNGSDRVLQKTPFTFDVSVWEFFWPFLSGASLVVAKPGGHQDPSYLVDIIAKQGITTLHFVPPMLAVFLEEPGLDRCTKLTRVICSGEALPLELQKRFFNKFATTGLHNLYGPTEAAIDVTSWACNRNGQRGIVPIGKAITNIQVYILDHKLQPVPIGVPGDLYLAGVGLARSYLNRPELTATSFIANPFSREAGARMYKTGDLCRWLPDGAVDFLGRIDHQVKIRGFRIELGEIESRLSSCVNVRHAVVLAQPDATGGKRLVAYVVPAQEPAPTTSELKGYLLGKLPDYMVPSRFVFLEELPLSANGKVNRHALQIPDSGHVDHASDYAVPQTPTEQTIANIFSELLRVEQVGRNDNFFDLGGHSLLATSVASRIRRAFSVEVQLRTLFEEPTVSGLADRIDTLIKSPDQGDQAALPLEMMHHDSMVPLSYTQQRFWFLAHLAEGTSLNNTSTLIPLRGFFDLDALEKALTELFRRHETLRSTFDVIEGEPMQFIAPPRSAQFSVIDLRNLPEGRRQEEVKRLQNLEYSSPFDLVRGPAVRFTLVRMNERRQVLLVGIHHIISDGWSLGVLAREISALYAAFRAGQASPLPELPIQYADYVLWQREKLGGGALERQLAFWKEKLDGVERLQLITDRPRPKIPRYKSAGVPVIIDSELTSKLLNLSRQEEATLFMTLLAAFQIVLGWHAGQEDVVVGTVVAGRERPELEQLIGVFINTLAMRTDLSGNPNFRQLLRRVKKYVLDVFDNKDVPFDKLVEVIAPERAMGMQPLFQVLFVMENMPLQSMPGKKKARSHEGGGIGANLQVHSITTVKMYYDITLTLTDFTSHLGGGLHYNTDLFDAATAESIARHFMILLNQIVDQPEQRVASIEMFSDQERNQILHEWNTTAPSCVRCIHQLFEERVDQAPDQVALAFEGQELSYVELDRQANRIAHRLRHLAVQAESAVGMYLDRGADAIVALLGILKAGGVYVPLDTALPPERLTLILEDVRPGVVLTQSALRSSLPVSEAAVLCLDDPSFDLSDAHNSRLSCVAPDNLAYIIYTSGSTGRPKGVMIEHRNLVHTIVAQIPLFGIDTNSKVLQTISLSFDASLGEIFRALVAGATLYLAKREELLPGPDLLRLLREQHITTVSLSTAALGALPFEELPELRTLTVGGEALSPVLAARWGKGRRLLNGYGPTEATIGVTLATDWAYGRTPPLGKLLPNARGYVLNTAMQLLPEGIPGELYLGGPGLARGYHNRPDLTADRFIPGLIGDKPGARLYRTGDRVRWLSDGQLEFLGRVDEQVKIRGCRIEPGEIAAVLHQKEDVHDVAVIARPDGGAGDMRLVAYIVWTNKDDGSKKAAKNLVDEWEKASIVAAANYNANEVHDPKLNFRGWTSSYTGEAIPLAEMCDWADATVARIRSLKPQELLEIGCGTGLILYRLAPYCQRYVGIDLGAPLLEITRSHLHLLDDTGCQVELYHRPADQLEDWTDGAYDCVMMNSVVQYFPDVDYLLKVLDHAVRLTRDGGNVFIGDVRNLKLLDAFHGVVQLGIAAATVSGSDLLQRIRRHLWLERELVIDPALFSRIASEWPRVSHVRVMPKAGRAHNELNDFRYDVVLEIACQPPKELDCTWLVWDWQVPVEGFDALRKALAASPERMGVRSIPNARTLPSVKLLERLQNMPQFMTVAQLREEIGRVESGVEPDDLIALAREMGCEIELSWLDCDVEGKFNALFWRAGKQPQSVFPVKQGTPAGWRELASNPAEESSGRNITSELREYLLKQLPEYMVPSSFMFLKALPLTANGKLDRQALPVPDDEERRADLAKCYEAPRTEVEKVLADIWAVLLRLERVGIHDNFFELGGDSILSIRAVAKANEAGLTLTAQDAYRYQTIEELATAARGDVNITNINQGLVTGTAPLTPTQHWFFEWDNPEPHHFNWATYLPAPRGMTSEDFRRALKALIEHHDALRARYITNAEGIREQIFAPVHDDVPLTEVDLSGVSFDEYSSAMEAKAEQLQASLNLEQGPLLRLAWFNMGEKHPGQILFIVHHIVVDAISMPILIGDLTTMLRQARAGELITLPAKTCSFKQWAEQLVEFSRSGITEDEQRYWLDDRRREVARLRIDNPKGDNSLASAQDVIVTLGEDVTNNLLSFARTTKSATGEVLLVALGLTLMRYTKNDRVLINIGRDGREDISKELNFTRTVGWFTSISPALIELPQRMSANDAFRSGLEQLRAIPNHGLGYQILRYLGEDAIKAELSKQPEAEVVFNYSGKQGGGASENQGGPGGKRQASVGTTYSTRAIRRHLIEINSSIQAGELQLCWTYSSGLLEPSRIDLLTSDYVATLREILDSAALGQNSF